MKQPEVRDAIISALKEVAGPDCRTPIADQTKPIGQLGFESCDGVDFACILSDKLGHHIPDDQNPFVDDSRRRARTVDEIVQWAQALLAEQKEKKHA